MDNNTLSKHRADHEGWTQLTAVSVGRQHRAVLVMLQREQATPAARLIYTKYLSHNQPLAACDLLPASEDVDVHSEVTAGATCSGIDSERADGTACGIPQQHDCQSGAELQGALP